MALALTATFSRLTNPCTLVHGGWVNDKGCAKSNKMTEGISVIKGLSFPFVVFSK